MFDPRTFHGRLLLGDEAVALGALDAGVSAAYAYPGTPSTEIFEFIEAEGVPLGVVAHWTANEKTAYEAALGVSMAGRRALVSMKHVGLNVAMDPFVNSAVVRIRGGLVVAVADDPSMHSSQNEQDSRVLADFAGVPCLEPATQQEAYDMVREAFDLSERLRSPVLLRLVTRLCHGRARVRPAVPRGANPLDADADPADWVLLPANARRLWRERASERAGDAAATDDSRWNVLDLGAGTTDADSSDQPPDLDGWPVRGTRAPFAVVTTGLARTHLDEARADLPFDPPHLHVGEYPLPTELVRSLAGLADRIIVLEEGRPFVESRLRGVLGEGPFIDGRESGCLPRTGELTAEDVRSALGLPRLATLEAGGLVVPLRPPPLCKGCPHRDAFTALGRAMDRWPGGLVTGDIGCYTLGALPPWTVLGSCVCMGASIGMAKGAADAGVAPVVAVIGDSTFLHSGVTALMDAAARDTPMTVLILDNETVAMTGQQPTVLPESRLLPLVLSLGVDPDHVVHVETHPRRVDDLIGLLEREIAHPGLSVVIAFRECVEAARKRKRDEALPEQPAVAGGPATGEAP